MKIRILQQKPPRKQPRFEGGELAAGDVIDDLPDWYCERLVRNGYAVPVEESQPRIPRVAAPAAKKETVIDG